MASSGMCITHVKTGLRTGAGIVLRYRAGGNARTIYVQVGGLKGPKTFSSYRHASTMKMTYMMTQAKPTL